MKTEYPRGCYDPNNCEQTKCRQNCVDCTSNTTCTSCEYGYFLLNTPDLTIECVQCPNKQYVKNNKGGFNESNE